MPSSSSTTFSAGPVDVDLLAFEETPLRIPRKEDDDAERHSFARRRVTDPLRFESACHARLLADALRADDDVRQVEVNVGECGQQLQVEARRSVVALPAVAGLHELVDAVLGQRRDQSRKVAVVLRDRVSLPQFADLVVLPRRELTADEVDDGVALDVLELGHRTNSAIVRKATGSWVPTSSVVAPDSRHASSRSAIRSRGPTSATSSTSASGTAAIASRCFPSR